MAGPGVFVEFFEILRQFCTQRVEMDIADEFQEIRVFFAHNGFVSVLEEVAVAFVAFIEGYCISGHEAAHVLC